MAGETGKDVVLSIQADKYLSFLTAKSCEQEEEKGGAPWAVLHIVPSFAGNGNGLLG